MSAWDKIINNPSRFFYVEFRTKTQSRNSGRPAGSIRKMLCKRPVHKYKRNRLGDMARDLEDKENNVITVWDVQKFNELRKKGISKRKAGWLSYRRINLDDVISLSIK
jgi:hypothetical protein